MSSSIQAVDHLIEQVQSMQVSAAAASSSSRQPPAVTKDKRWWPLIPVGHTAYTWGVEEHPTLAAEDAPAAAPAPAAATEAPAAAAATPAPGASAPKPKGEKKEKAPKAPKEKKSAAPAAADVSQPEFTKLDIRVGQIVSARVHPKPEVESLFVEEIDVGEAEPRTIVSGLRKYYSLEEFSKMRVCVVCNLKPSALQGVVSAGMVLAASKTEGESRVVELVAPPEGAPVGARLLPLDGAEDYSQYAPLAEVNPKKKNNAWTAVAEKLKTNDNREATWEGKVIGTKEHGPAKAPTLTGVNIG